MTARSARGYSTSPRHDRPRSRAPGLSLAFAGGSRSFGAPAGSRHRLSLAASSSDRISPLPEERVFCASGSAGSSVCAIGQCITAECISRGTEFPTEFPPSASGALLIKTTLWVTSHLKVAALLSANARTIRGRCTVVGKAVGADYRAIGQVAKQQVREFLYAVSLPPSGILPPLMIA